MNDDERKRRKPWSFDPFFDMDREFDRMHRMMDEMMRMMTDENFHQEKPFVYGFTLRKGPDGEPRMEEFGNARSFYDNQEEGSSKPQIEGKREPLTDVIESEDSVAITVELPGVSKENINLDASKDMLIIDVNDPHHKYYKEIKLPCHVDPDSADATCNNGVLDVTLKKVHDSSRKRIDVK